MKLLPKCLYSIDFVLNFVLNSILFQCYLLCVKSYSSLMQERGQVMTCINLLALNNKLYCSHLELRLRLLEMAATAALSDLREGSYTADNAAQLIRWIYDLTVIDPNQDHSKKASTKV